MNSILVKTMALAATTTSLSIATVAVSFPAQAASFTPFPFKTNVTASPTSNPSLLNDPTKDVQLNSVEFNGRTISQFELVKNVTILQDDGVLASGHGPNTPLDNLVGEGPATVTPTDADITASLNNLNLNSIVVTRESGALASVEVSFQHPVRTFFFWERGGTAGGSVAGDSDILVEALSDDGNTVLASYKILRANYTKAGYNITTDVQAFQVGPLNVGSIGLRLDGATTKTLRLTSETIPSPTFPAGGDNGPDYKIVAQAVPEPSIIAGLLVAGGLGAIQKRKKAALD